MPACDKNYLVKLMNLKLNRTFININICFMTINLLLCNNLDSKARPYTNIKIYFDQVSTNVLLTVIVVVHITRQRCSAVIVMCNSVTSYRRSVVAVRPADYTVTGWQTCRTVKSVKSKTNCRPAGRRCRDSVVRPDMTGITDSVLEGHVFFALD